MVKKNPQIKLLIAYFHFKSTDLFDHQSSAVIVGEIFPRTLNINSKTTIKKGSIRKRALVKRIDSANLYNSINPRRIEKSCGPNISPRNMFTTDGRKTRRNPYRGIWNIGRIVRMRSFTSSAS